MRVPAPRLVDVSAPIALARVPHWVSAPPRNHPAIKAAAKASPAPTVSWTVTSKGDTSNVPVAVAIVHPAAPRFRTTTRGPISRIADNCCVHLSASYSSVASSSVTSKTLDARNTFDSNAGSINGILGPGSKKTSTVALCAVAKAANRSEQSSTSLTV